ncbi:MAG: ATP-binding protein [Pseudomonadota bacterium]|nr:ATP-binding protein [Pseudomonadota bacterium]
MLVQFTVKNFRSFKEESTLYLTAISAYKEHEYNLIDYGQKEKLVKVAAIYGANASGKSNLFYAFSVFQKIVVESFNNIDSSKNERTAISEFFMPFCFDKEKNNTEFEIVVIKDNYEYKYGFEYNSQNIVTEWLYRKSFETQRTSIILERTSDNIVFGTSVKKHCEQYKEQIPNETLALSFFNKLKLNTDLFKIVYDEIIATLVTDMNIGSYILANDLPHIIDNQKEGILSFLYSIETGIKDIKYEKVNNKINFYTTHYDKEGNSYDINLLEESQGTIKSIAVYVLASIAIANDKSIFVDELNIKLHPLLLKFIIDLFYNKKSKAQLIYTTHDTTLLDKKFFRRDQIWFVQKDEYGHSELTALSDFKVRSDASFEKDYLAGVYGGIPLIKDFEMDVSK